MKKTILTIAIALITICSFSQAHVFSTVSNEIASNGQKDYKSSVGDTIRVDSVQVTYNCYFAQVGNPYVDTLTHAWTMMVQVTGMLNGSPDASSIINQGKRTCEAWRKLNYPNTGP